MDSWRAQNRNARRVLHQHMRVPALYIEGSLPAPVPCYVRVWNEHRAKGGVKGTSFAYAEREDDVPQIVFMLDQIIPKRGAVVSVEPGEAYKIDHTETNDDITVTTGVVKLTPEQASGLPVPADYDVAFDATYNAAVFPALSTQADFFQVVFPSISPAAPQSVQADTMYIWDLATATMLVDQRSDLHAGHDYLSSGRLQPYALGEEILIKLDLTIESSSLDNSVRFCMDVGGTTGVIVSDERTLAQTPTGRTQNISLLTKLPVSSDFLANAGEIITEFSGDAVITEASMYVSL